MARQRIATGIYTIALLPTLGCGARSDLLSTTEDHANGAGGGAAQCAKAGEVCVGSADCCDMECVNGACALPPPACLGDEHPMSLATGLADPYALAGNSSSLFVGQWDADQPLLRIAKTGGSAESLLKTTKFVDTLLVREKKVFLSEDGALSAVPTSGGEKEVLAAASRPAGLDITPDYVYFADQATGQLLEMDRATLELKALGSQPLPNIYRVAAAESHGLIYFSSAANGVRRYHLSYDTFDSIGTATPPARAVRIVGENVYFTVPDSVQIYRVGVVDIDLTLFADLSALGVFPEALESDGSYLYVTLETGGAVGLIVRVPIGGGQPEVVTDAQGPRPAGLVVDDGCVYWTERTTGSVFRASKLPQ